VLGGNRCGALVLDQPVQVTSEAPPQTGQQQRSGSRFAGVLRAAFFGLAPRGRTSSMVEIKLASNVTVVAIEDV
jgi:hypothetical protein